MKNIFFFLMFLGFPLRADMDLNAEICNELEAAKDDREHTAILAQQLATLNPPLTQFFSQWPGFLYEMIVQQDKPRFCLVVMMSMLPASQNFIRQYLRELKSLAETYNGDLRLSFVGCSRFENCLFEMLRGNERIFPYRYLIEKVLNSHWIDPRSQEKSLDNLESLILNLYPTDTFESVVAFLSRAIYLYTQRHEIEYQHYHDVVISTRRHRYKDFRKSIPHGALPWVIGASYTEKGAKTFELSAYTPNLIDDIKNRLHLEEILPTEKKEDLDRKNVPEKIQTNPSNFPLFKKEELSPEDLQKLVDIAKKFIFCIEQIQENFLNLVADFGLENIDQESVNKTIKKFNQEYKNMREHYETFTTIFPESKNSRHELETKCNKNLSMIRFLGDIEKFFTHHFLTGFFDSREEEKSLEENRLFLKKFIQKNRSVLPLTKMIVATLKDVLIWLESPNKAFALSQPLIARFGGTHSTEDPEKKAYRLFNSFKETFEKYAKMIKNLQIESEYKETKEREFQKYEEGKDIKKDEKMAAKIKVCQREQEKLTMALVENLLAGDPCWRLKEVIGNLETAQKIRFLLIPATSQYAKNFIHAIKNHREKIASCTEKRALVVIAVPCDEVCEYVIKELVAQNDPKLFLKNLSQKGCAYSQKKLSHEYEQWMEDQGNGTGLSLFLKCLSKKEIWDQNPKPEKMIAHFNAWLETQGKTPLTQEGGVDQWSAKEVDMDIWEDPTLHFPDRNQKVVSLFVLKEKGKIVKVAPYFDHGMGCCGGFPDWWHQKN